MKLLVFTPTNKNSAIGRSAALVVHQLIRLGHQVMVIKTESSSLREIEDHDFGTNIYFWKDYKKVISLLSEFDYLIYHIGDCFSFHQGALYWLFRFKGLVCLHDFCLSNLMNGWIQESMENQKKFKKIISYYRDQNDSDLFFNEIVCSIATGVLTHSQWGCSKILKSCSGPMRVVPLAYNSFLDSHQSGNQDKSNDRFKLLTIGHVNENKRYGSVLHAIGEHPILKEKIEYRLIGKIQTEMSQKLMHLAKKLNVKLIISGEMSDADLHQGFYESDAVACLRFPTLEAASASVIESMLSGKPVIVNDVGFYSEIPNEYVFRVSLENEIEDIQRVLLQMLSNRSHCQEIAARAKHWAQETFTAENYANETLKIIDDIFQADPIVQGVQFFASKVASWSGDLRILQEEEFLKNLKIFER